MSYSIEKLPNGRWGIYAERQLLATIGCHRTGLTILELLHKKKRLKANIDQSSTLITNKAA